MTGNPTLNNMTELLIYQGKAAIALAVFYMFYRLLLSKETFHRFNRIVLLSTAALSFVLPLCVITFKEVVVVPAMKASSETIVAEVAETVAMVPEASAPIWPVVLCSLFVLGALAVLVHVAVSIIGIRRIISNGSRQTLESGETLIITETDTAPFSWMKYIVISREDYQSGYSHILTHEKAHIALRHSWDILFVDMITALQWFNPAIWMLKADLRALHEFEADDAVLRSGANIKEYQYLLIRKAVSKSGYSVANSFNHSTLKARITMMLNQKSSRMSAWKALYVIPLVGISLAATAETKVDYIYEEPEVQSDTTGHKVIELRGNHKEDGEKSWRKTNARETVIMADEKAKTVTIKYLNSKFESEEKVFTGIDFSNDVWLTNSSVITKDLADKMLKQDEVVYASRYLDNGKKVNVVLLPTLEANVVKLEELDPKPLYVVDGIPMDDKFNIESINPEEIKEITVLKDDNAAGKYGEAGKNGVIEIATKNPQTVEIPVANGAAKIMVRPADGKGYAAIPLVVIDGEPAEKDFDLNSIDPHDIESISVRKDDSAKEKYGEAAKDGVIEITLKKGDANEQKPVPDIYIDGKKATSEEVAALPANPKGYVEPDGTVQLITEEKAAEKKEPVPFQHLGQKPGFNGGDANEFSKWVAANLKYPEKFRQSKVQGRVTLQFTITEKGEVTDVRVLRGVNEELDKEALRVVSASPRWTPGKDKNGNIVPVIFTFPVLFQL